MWMGSSRGKGGRALLSRENLDTNQSGSTLILLTPRLIFVVDSRQCAAKFAHTALCTMGQ